MENCCKVCQDLYEGKRVKDIPILNDSLEEESTDYATWTTHYKCKTCGANWIEKYVDKGHGEVPVTERVKNTER